MYELTRVQVNIIFNKLDGLIPNKKQDNWDKSKSRHNREFCRAEGVRHFLKQF